MKRDIEALLSNWKSEKGRIPLLLRGARQVGKSYTIAKFGRTEFGDFVAVNFEQNPHYKECFTSLEPKEIIQSISLLCKKDIVPGKTLLFFDEIQDCPRAVTSLRYFYESLPEQHVIGAGSLLDFILTSEDFRMPVGRIQYVYMKPLSFLEFLDAAEESKARDYIENSMPDATQNSAIHKHLISLLKKYMILGGMPAVVNEYITTGNLNKCHRIQTSIIQTYSDDFGKYANRVKHKYLQMVFYACPKMAGKKFKYSQVDPTVQSRNIKEAVEQLEKAGIIYRVKKASGSGVPLEAYANERHFKLVFLDIGLMQNMCGLSEEMLLAKDIMAINAGALAEQLVAQELLAYQSGYKTESLYYWAREARNSSAEIDYLVPFNSTVIPVEVKSGKTGTLRSMHLYLGKYKTSTGIKISQAPLNLDPPIISIPLHAAVLLTSKKLKKLMRIR